MASDEANDGPGTALLLAVPPSSRWSSRSQDADVSGVEPHDHIATNAPTCSIESSSTGDVASKDAAEFVQRTRCTVLQKPFELRALEAHVARVRERTPA
jgi:hypothetical protein